MERPPDTPTDFAKGAAKAREIGMERLAKRLDELAIAANDGPRRSRPSSGARGLRAKHCPRSPYGVNFTVITSPSRIA